MSSEPSERGRAWSRRLFLKASALGVGAGAVGLGFWLRGDGLDRLGHGGRGADSAGALGAEDLADIAALAEVLHSPEDDRERRELAMTVRWWATGRSSRGPLMPVYRDGLRALGRAARRAGHEVRFSQLALADREAIVSALFSPDGGGAFQALGMELLEGIYASAPGWRVVGYSTWPGVASAPLEYTRAPGQPIGPVGMAARPGGGAFDRVLGSAAQGSA